MGPAGVPHEWLRRWLSAGLHHGLCQLSESAELAPPRSSYNAGYTWLGRYCAGRAWLRRRRSRHNAGYSSYNAGYALLPCLRSTRTLQMTAMTARMHAHAHVFCWGWRAGDGVAFVSCCI